MIIFPCHELLPFEFFQIGKCEALSAAGVVVSFVIKNSISSADYGAAKIKFSCLHLAFKLFAALEQYV